MSVFTRAESEQIIQRLGLLPLPTEGGLFRQTWRKDGVNVVIGTATFAALTDDPDSFSAMHQLPGDEIWHFYAGDPVDMLLLHADGSWTTPELGNNLCSGQWPQVVVPAGTWMGARLAYGGTFALFGNTMAPGFTSKSYRGAQFDELATLWPSAAGHIRTLLRPGGEIKMPPGF